MIDVKTEKLVTLAQACTLIPPGRNGRPVHSSTLVRAIKFGTNGAKLEALRVGGRWCTSIEGLQRWLERQTAVMSGEPIGPRTSLQNRRAAVAACARLEKAGC